MCVVHVCVCVCVARYIGSYNFNESGKSRLQHIYNGWLTHTAPALVVRNCDACCGILYILRRKSFETKDKQPAKTL